MKKSVGFVAVVMFVIHCVALQAAVYYVSPSGDDDADGSEATPWQTIQHGVDQLSGGDTLMVMEGAYYEAVTITHLANGLSLDEPTVIEGVGLVTIRNPATSGCQLRFAGSLAAPVRFLRVSGFTISTRAVSAVSASYLQDSILENLACQAGAETVQHDAYGINLVNVTRCTIRDNTCSGSRSYGHEGTGSGNGYYPHTYGLYVNGDDNRIEGNVLVNNSGHNFTPKVYGLYVMGNRNVIAANYASRNYDTGMSMGNGRSYDLFIQGNENTIDDNTIWMPGWPTADYGAEVTGTSNRLVRNRFKLNRLIMKGGFPFLFNNYFEDSAVYFNSGSSFIRIEHNTFISYSSPDSIIQSFATGVSGIHIYNNVFYLVYGGKAISDSTANISGYDVDYNAFYNDTSYRTQTENGVPIARSDFVDMDNRHYVWADHSAAINAADDGSDIGMFGGNNAWSGNNLDVDADDLPDIWELAFLHTSAIYNDNSHEDPDADGLENIHEYMCRTFPRDSDSDNDGISDWNEDYDGDGVGNGNEIQSGADPAVTDTWFDQIEPAGSFDDEIALKAFRDDEALLGTAPDTESAWGRRTFFLKKQAGEFEDILPSEHAVLFEGNDVNEAGVIVGRIPEGGLLIYDSETFLGETVDTGLGDQALAINEYHTIVGGSGDRACWAYEPEMGEDWVLLARSHTDFFGAPHIACSRMTDVNDAGEMIGYTVQDNWSEIVPLSYEPFYKVVWHTGKTYAWRRVVTPVEVEENGEIVIRNLPVYHNLGHLGGSKSRPVAINESGWVVGSSWTAAGKERAFLRADGGMIDLGTLGGESSRAADINVYGQVVCQGENAAQQPAAGLYENGTLHDLAGCALGVAATVLQDKTIRDIRINDQGQLAVVTEDVSGGWQIYILKPVDSDGDGIGNAIERLYLGTDPYEYEAEGGETSFSAQLVGQGPGELNMSAATGWMDFDRDGDGLTDYEETVIHGTDPTNPDTDGDGFSDWARPLGLIHFDDCTLSGNGIRDAGLAFRMWINNGESLVSLPDGAGVDGSHGLYSNRGGTSNALHLYVFTVQGCLGEPTPQPGGYYRLSFKGKGSGDARIQVYPENNCTRHMTEYGVVTNAWVWKSPRQFTLTSEWATYSTVFYLPEDDTFIGWNANDAFQSLLKLMGDGEYYLDDIRLEQVNPVYDLDFHGYSSAGQMIMDANGILRVWVNEGEGLAYTTNGNAQTGGELVSDRTGTVTPLHLYVTTAQGSKGELPPRPGRTYRMTFMGRGTGDARLNVYWNINASRHLTENGVEVRPWVWQAPDSFDLTPTWETYSATFTLPEDDTFIGWNSNDAFQSLFKLMGSGRYQFAHIRLWEVVQPVP